MIVEAFKDALDLGLEKPEQIVVSTMFVLDESPSNRSAFWGCDDSKPSTDITT